MSLKSQPQAAKQPPVSPPILIALIVVLIAAVYLQFFSGPAKETPSTSAGPVATPAPQRKVTSTGKPAQGPTPAPQLAEPTADEVLTQDTDIQPQSWTAVNRNPFEPPVIVLRNRLAKDEVASLPAAPSPVTGNEFQIASALRNLPAALEKASVAAPEKSVPEEKPVWKGIISTNSGQIALVGFHNKTSLLRVGARLEDTSYQLAEITPQFLLFNSETGRQLKVEKKEATQK
jgi:hypothetical protein